MSSWVQKGLITLAALYYAGSHMNNRTRIVNDPADLVPLLQVFKSDSHKRVFSSLLNGWKTENELEEILQEDIYNSLEILKKIGLIESKWRMPEPGHTPQIEYHTCYSKLRADFQCLSLIHISEPTRPY